jgi:hypothetical protein
MVRFLVAKEFNGYSVRGPFGMLHMFAPDKKDCALAFAKGCNEGWQSAKMCIENSMVEVDDSYNDQSDLVA